MAVDLLKVFPEKFHSSELLQAYFDTYEYYLDDFITKTGSLLQLQDPNEVSATYLQRLANLLNFKLSNPDSVSDAIRRNELIGAVDWYKMKGTYESLLLIALWVKFDFTIYDKYTNDYSTFVDQEWFVGEEDENPTGLDSTYYKSPHFGLSVSLNQVRDAGTYDEGYLDRHLWRPSLFVGITDHVEKTRPVNTVPSYLIEHNCLTDETLAAVEIATTETVTKIVGTWPASKLVFDGDGLSTPNQRYFDNGDQFDQDPSSYIATITGWKLSTGGGSGMLDLTQDSSSYSLDNVVLTGTVDGYSVSDSEIQIWFTVPQATVQYDISQLGLYVQIPSEELIIASTFPEINKGSSTALKVIVTIDRSQT